MLTSQDLQNIRGVVREEIQDAVPGMIETGIQKTVPGMIQKEVGASELRMIKKMKSFVHSEHVKTRATINEVVDYFDKRVRVTEHRLDRVERTLDLPKFSN